MRQSWIVAGTAVSTLLLAAGVAWLISPDAGDAVPDAPAPAVAVAAAPRVDTDAPSPPVVRRRVDFPTFEDTDAPKPPRPPPPLPVGIPEAQPDAVPRAVGGPLPADVRGVERLFTERHPDAVKACVRMAGLEPEPGEALRLLLTIVPTGPQSAGIQVLQAADDGAGRYTGVLTCLAQELEGTVFEHIPQGTGTQVPWAVQL